MAIQEFDKHHIPEIVTRFEAPLTARMYRRSSSAPIPEVDGSVRPSRKSRASSTQPAGLELITSSTTASSPLPQDTKQEALPETFYMSSFDQYSFPSQTSPSFVRGKPSVSSHTDGILLGHQSILFRQSQHPSVRLRLRPTFGTPKSTRQRRRIIQRLRYTEHQSIHTIVHQHIISGNGRLDSLFFANVCSEQ